MNCWICGALANTGEHKIKKSLLVALHGRGPYHAGKELLHVCDNVSNARRLLGPDADQAKFRHVLCSKCNNETSQAFDNAYEAFHRYILNSETLVVARRVVDFVDVYGSVFERFQRDLYKYLVKLFGCCLAQNGCQVPADLRALLDLEQFRTKLRITFAVNEDALPIPEVQNRPVGIGPLVTTQKNAKTKTDPRYVWSVYFSFLHIVMWYDWMPDGPYGTVWTADSRYLYLGWLAPLDPKTRDELVRRTTVPPVI